MNSPEIMFRVTVFAIALNVVLAGDRNKCGRLFHPEAMHCCKNDAMPLPLGDMKDELKECLKIPHGNPSSCEFDICIAKKRGIASDDGTIDMDAYEKMITEDFKTNPALLEALKENCIKGDISKYGPPDACELFKLKICTHRAVILDCKEWDDNGPCAGIKDLIRECAKMDE